MKYALVLLEKLLNLGLNSTDKLVMGMVISLTIKRGECTANNEYFSKYSELSERTISKTLSKLKRKKLISIKTCNNKRVIYSNIEWNYTSMGIDDFFYLP